MARSTSCSTGASTRTKGGGLRATFEGVPDAPVSSFVLEMKGGRKGLLENNTNLCARGSRAVAQIDGQNGKSAGQRPLVATAARRRPARAGRDPRHGAGR